VGYRFKPIEHLLPNHHPLDSLAADRLMTIAITGLSARRVSSFEQIRGITTKRRGVEHNDSPVCNEIVVEANELVII
jgi:hypothetical protein